MRRSLCALLLAGTGYALPQIVARADDGGTTTVTLGPVEGYVQPAGDEAPPITGMEMAVVAPNSIGRYAPEGVDIYIGTELLQKLKDTVSEHCPELNAPNCHSSVQAVLEERTVGLQTRIAPVVAPIGYALAAIAAGLAYVLSGNADRMRPSDKFHLSPEDVTQINDIPPTATQVTIETAVGDPNPILVYGDEDPPVDVATVGSPYGGHSTGDIVITLRQDIANAVQDTFDQLDDTCPAAKAKRSLDPCLESLATGFMRTAGAPGAPLRDVLVLPNALPNLGAGEMATLFGRVLDAGRQMTELALDPASLEALAEISVFLAYGWLIVNDQNLRQTFIPSSAVDGTEPDDEHKSCPLEAPRGKDAPACDSCGGTREQKVCTEGEWTHCECLLRMNYEVQPTDYTWLTIQQLILEEAAADVATDSQMSEGKIERSDEQVTIERDFFTALAKEVCMTTNINMGSFEETKGPSSLGTDVWEQYEGAEAKFRWEKDENADSCQELDCEGVFSNLQSGCSFNSHTMSRSGSLTFNCGKISYEYTPPPEPEPEPEPSFGPMTCHRQKTCPMDVDPETVRRTARQFCDNIKGRKLSAENWGVRSPDLLSHWIDESPAERTQDWYYQFWAFWDKDDDHVCDMESERDISEGDCYENFYSTYRDCNNGGNGGYHQIGCVIMGFEPDCGQTPSPRISGPGVKIW